MEPDTTPARVDSSSPVKPSLSTILDFSRSRPWFSWVFPRARLTSIDYAIALALLTACFFSFANTDLDYLGQNSLNFLFGNPLDFYDNAKKFQPAYGGATYPPAVYAVFALWLSPWKLLGVITGPNALPPYLIYWLKLATTITYLTASHTFYLIAKEYFPDAGQAKYAMSAFFTAPLAVFSQFIYSQTDIFHVQLMLLGYLMFVRNRLGLASFFFGLSVTFKSFPAICFFPLLLLLEKRPTRLAVFVLVFMAPTLLVNIVYSHSPAFTHNPINELLHERLYVASVIATDDRTWIDGDLRLYLLPLAYAMLCGFTYFRHSSPETRLQDSAYVWLTSSVLLFVPILWHPNWVTLAVPPIVLTSMLSNRFRFLLALDLLGMASFVAAVSFIFQDSADAVMFRGDLLKVDFHNSYPMDNFFNWFGDHSESIFFTGFGAYLLLQTTLKYRLITPGTHVTGPKDLDYGDIRQRLYIGLAIFLIPVVLVIWRDLTSGEVSIGTGGYEQEYALTASSPVEQKFRAEGTTIKSVSLFLKTSGRRGSDELTVELVDAGGKSLARVELHTLPTHELSWHRFPFDTVTAVRRGDQYSFRVLSAKGAPGNAFSLLTTTEDQYGQAIVEGRPLHADLIFRIAFLR